MPSDHAHKGTLANIAKLKKHTDQRQEVKIRSLCLKEELPLWIGCNLDVEGPTQNRKPFFTKYVNAQCFGAASR